jgi:hypothetical protein
MEVCGDRAHNTETQKKELSRFHSSRSESETHQYSGDNLCTHWDQHWCAVNWNQSGDRIGSECVMGIHFILYFCGERSRKILMLLIDPLCTNNEPVGTVKG